MRKFKWFGAVLAAVSLVLIAVTLEGGTALGRQAEPSQPPLIAPAGALPDGGIDVQNYEFTVDDITIDGINKGNVTFTGTGTIVREQPVGDTIDTELVSLSLFGIVGGQAVRYEAGSGLGHTASLGTIVEPTLGAGCSPTACAVTMAVFFEITCGPTFGSDSCCETGIPCPSLENCLTFGDVFNGTTLVIPAVGVFNAADSSACLNGLTERATGTNLTALVSEVSVGGIAERLGTSAGPDSSLDSSSGSGFSYAALGGALAAAAVAVAVGGWYARRRWLT